MKIEDITKELRAEAQDNIIKYNQRVTPNTRPVLGVRVPWLRKKARQLAKEDYAFFLENCPEEYFEQQMMKAFVIGYAKDKIENILTWADRFIPGIQDWAVCDAFCQNLSIARDNRRAVWDWMQQYAAREEEFSQRVAAVILMSHFLTEEYIDAVLQMMNHLKCSAYYTKMGVAWCVATCYAQFPEKTMNYLHHNELDDWTYNKAIQKMKESFRVPDEDKVILSGLKRTV